MLKGSQNTSAKPDSEIPMIIDDVLVVFYNLGRRIARIVRDCPDCSDDSDQDLDQGLLTVPVDTRISGGKSGFNGRSVEDALLFVVNTCFLIDYLFHGRFTYTLIRKEAMIDDEINTKLEVLKRVADGSVYREIAGLCCESDGEDASAG